MPLLSIITINYNNRPGLEKTIESVINQTNNDFEFVLIDGDSSDGSKDLIEKYKSRFSYWVSEKDTGIYNAMNKGIKNTSGDYLLFLNSGDWLFDNNVIKKVQPFLKDVDVISGDTNIYDKGKWSVFVSEEQITVNYFLRISLFHHATFVKRELFMKSGLYDENFKLGGDYEFFIRTLLKENNTYQRIPHIISHFVADGISNNKAYEALNQKERSMAWEKNFSGLVYQHFQHSKQLSNSRELKWGRRFFRFFPFASAIDKLIARIWY